MGIKKKINLTLEDLLHWNVGFEAIYYTLKL